VVVRIESGESISRTAMKPIATSAAMKQAMPKAQSSTVRFFNRRKQSASPANRPGCRVSGPGVRPSHTAPASVAAA